MDKNHIIETLALTKVFGEGQKVTGLAIYYDEVMNGEILEKDTFSVEGRNVENIYTADNPEIIIAENQKRKEGRYIIIELDNNDLNALTVMKMPNTDGRPGAIAPTVIRDVKLEITQNKAVYTLGGKAFIMDESWTNNRVIQPLVDEFQVFTYMLPDQSERKVDYNLYIPPNYDNTKKYPLVFFIEDAGVMSDNNAVALCQGLGAVVWAEPEEQKKHPCFILAPQFHGPFSLVEDDFSCTWEVEAAMQLLRSVIEQYPIDKDRVYGTGQSMGCMTLCELNIRYPEVFGGCLLIGGQWNPETITKAKENNFWIVVSEGDEKAFPGMNAITESFEKAGETVGRGTLDAKSDLEEMNQVIKNLEKDGNHIHYTWFTGDSVIPDGIDPDPIKHHINTWRVAYQIEALRDWLFKQRKK